MDYERATALEQIQDVEDALNERETNILRAKMAVQNLRRETNSKSPSRMKPTDILNQLHQIKIALGL